MDIHIASLCQNERVTKSEEKPKNRTYRKVFNKGRSNPKEEPKTNLKEKPTSPYPY
jgi:hypothetical protein